MMTQNRYATYRFQASRSLFIFLCLLFVTAQTGGAQSSENTARLFQLNAQKSTGETLQKGDNLSITLNTDFLQQPVQVDDLIEIPFPSGSSDVYRITGVSEIMEGILSIRATHIDDPHNQMTFSYGNGQLIGSIDRFTTGDSWRLLPDMEQFHKSAPGTGSPHILHYRDRENEEILECGFGHEVTGDGAYQQHFHDPRSQSHQLSPYTVEPSLDAGVTIDLMIVYTDDAKSWAELNEGSIENLISEMINISQLTLDNSGLDIELRVVHTYNTDFEEDGNDSGNDLRRLTASPDFNPFGEEFDGYIEHIHDMRDTHGADLVAMIASVSDIGGLAWLMSSLGGTPQLGFSLNRVTQMTNSYTFMHEIGHNMGNVHSRNQNNEAANIFGGIFDFSTGWRFTDNTQQTNVTVMAYADGGATRIPYFSSPDLRFNGFRTGSYTQEYGPSDNVRSMQYARHIVSNYRMSDMDPPILNADDSMLEIEGFPDNYRRITFPISNDGASTLHWSADIAYKDQPLTKISHTANQTGIAGPEKPAIHSRVTRPDNKRQDSPQFKSQVADNFTFSRNVFVTGFESGAGYDAGEHLILNNWVAYPKDEDAGFEISTENPASGNQHLRLTPNSNFNENSYYGLQVPFQGQLTSQGYSISMDINISDDDSDNQLHIMLDDASSNMVTAWVWFDDGNIIVRNQVTEGGLDFFSSSGSWEAGQYHHFEMRIDPREEQILYLLDDQVIFNGELYAGSTPDDILIAHINYQTGETIDIDNFSIRSLQDSDFPRFQLKRQHGAIAANESQEITFRVIADDIPEGVYDFDVIVHTNDPSQPVFTKPVRYEVTETATSGGSDPEIAGFELHQNYPNPFNPVTNITYSIPESSDVRIDVININGQHVATLVDEYQSTGRHSVVFDASGLASGVYIYRLQAGSYRQSERMVLIK